MLLAYLDESFSKDLYVVAALLVPDVFANSLTNALDEVVRKTQLDYGRIFDTAELHGYDIAQGKGDWEPFAKEIRIRLGIYHKAMQAIADHDVRVIVRTIDVPRLHRRYTQPDHPHSIALTHVGERIHDCAQRENQFALMIADEVDDQDQYRRELWRYQRSTTWGYRARALTRIVDTIHFAPSRSSRLLQAADLIAYMALRRTVESVDERARREAQAIWARIQPRIRYDVRWPQ